MAILREGFRYTVRFVKQRNTKAGTVTDFQIGEKLNDHEYVNFSCTSFADLPLQDGDRVKIKRIGSIEVKEYKGKIFYDAVVDVELLDSTDSTGRKVEEPVYDDAVFDL